MTTLNDRIIGAAEIVNSELPSGLRENAYHKSMLVELSNQGIMFTTEASFSIMYRDLPVAFVRPDIIATDGNGEYRIVELKAGKSGVRQAERYLDLSQNAGYDYIDGAIAISFGDNLEYTII